MFIFLIKLVIVSDNSTYGVISLSSRRQWWGLIESSDSTLLVTMWIMETYIDIVDEKLTTGQDHVDVGMIKLMNWLDDSLVDILKTFFNVNGVIPLIPNLGNFRIPLQLKGSSPNFKVSIYGTLKINGI